MNAPGAAVDAACTWPIDLTGCAGFDNHPAPVRAVAESVAAQLLWVLSGRQFGLCVTTVRPVPRTHPDVLAHRRWERYLEPHVGGWVSFCGCAGFGPDNGCGCQRLEQISLPGRVHRVIEVRVDGQQVDPGAYRVDNWRWLLRVDGGRWPHRQDLAAAPDAPGAFTVTYERGSPVPVAGRWAAGQLACELARAMTGDKACRLPRRVASVVRQGVSTEFADPAQLARDGMTGIPEVDGWLAAVNPHRLPHDSVVWSPDLPSTRRRTS